MTLNTYGHVIAELREAPRLSATEQIYAARAKDPRKTPRRENAIPPKQKIAPPPRSRRPDSNRRPLHYE
jgi:hypothetical protein